jgi:hypothetical protein
MAHDVFISYASNDKTIADAVCAKLESMGRDIWGNILMICEFYDNQSMVDGGNGYFNTI